MVAYCIIFVIWGICYFIIFVLVKIESVLIAYWIETTSDKDSSLLWKLDLQKNNNTAQISAFFKERKYSNDVQRKIFSLFHLFDKRYRASTCLVSWATRRKKMSQLLHDNPNISFSFEILKLSHWFFKVMYFI